MTNVPWTLVLLALLEMATPQLEEGSVWAGVVAAVTRQLYVGCVFLTYSDLNQSVAALQLQKFLADEGVPTSLIPTPLNASGPEFQCSRNLPLRVIIPSRPDAIASTRFSDSRWILLLQSRSSEELLKDINIPFNCLFLVAKRRRNRVVLTEIYRKAPNMVLEQVAYGNWSREHGLSSTTWTLPESRLHLMGVTLNVVTVDELPTNPNNTDLLAEIWRSLQVRLSFRSKYSRPPDGAWGSPGPKGRWNGMVGMLQRGEVDLALNTFLVSDLRSRVVDFSIPIFYSRFCVYVREPESVELVWTNFLRPFSADLWMTISAAILILAVFITGLGLIVGRYSSQEKHGFYDAIHYVFGVFCLQGHSFNQLGTPSRTVYVATYLTAVTLMSAYSAELISSITTQRPHLPFTSLSGLLLDGRYSLGVLAKSEVPALFKAGNSSILEAIYDRLLKPCEDAFPTSQLEGLKRVCSQTHYAFMMPCYSTAHLLKQLPCTVLSLPKQYFYVTASIAFPKRSPYRKLIDHNLLIMQLDGVFSKLHRDELGQALAQATDFTSVNLTAAAPILGILVFGLLSAVLVLILELTFRCIRRKRWQRPMQVTPC